MALNNDENQPLTEQSAVCTADGASISALISFGLWFAPSLLFDLFQPLTMTRSFLQNVFAHYQFPFRVRTIFKGDRPPPRGPLKETRSKLALQTYKRGVPRAPCQKRKISTVRWDSPIQ